MNPVGPDDGPPVTLSREEILELFDDLGAELARSGLRGELFVVGGAAMALTFDARRLTNDVDVVFEPKLEVFRAAAAVARRRGLRDDWLNDVVKALLPGNDEAPREVLSTDALSVSVPSPRYLLALKVAAARVDRDVDDIAVLADACGVSTAREILDIAEQIVGRRHLPPKSQFLVEQMFPDDGGPVEAD